MAAPPFPAPNSKINEGTDVERVGGGREKAVASLPAPLGVVAVSFCSIPVAFVTATIRSPSQLRTAVHAKARSLSGLVGVDGK